MKYIAIVILMLTSIQLVYSERTSWWEADENDFSNSILKITSHGIIRDEKGKIVYPTNWDTKSYTSTAPPLLEHGKKYTFTISFQNMTSETFQGDIYLTIKGGMLNEEGNGFQENVRKDIIILNNIVISPKENKEYTIIFDAVLTQIPEGIYKIFYKLREGQFKKQIPTPDLLNDYDKNVLQDLVIGRNTYNKHLKILKKAQKAQDEEASELRNKHNENDTVP